MRIPPTTPPINAPCDGCDVEVNWTSVPDDETEAAAATTEPVVVVTGAELERAWLDANDDNIVC